MFVLYSLIASSLFSFIYTPSAVACQNVLSDRYCGVAYPARSVSQGYPTENSGAQRPLLCYTLAAATPALIDIDAKTAAIAHCPKTCGYCCQTSAYNCRNVNFPRLSCSTVTRSMCQSVVWRQILAEDCPNICGFCDLNGCIDAVVGCDNDISICNAIGMQEFVNQNCRRTCNRCLVATPKPCNG
uniref:ShKT domain-containing protein n=1 Tax=Caenorhabditis tropicalis TaxID=1561998 RepID=A0A1I7TXP0_9PELO